MKTRKCVICTKVRGKRGCFRRDGELICPRCCAEIRGQECAGCPYYTQAERYEADRISKKSMPSETFTARIDPEIEEQVDQALIVLEKGDTVTAEFRLKSLLRDNPDLYITHYGMGAFYALKNELDQAQICLSRAVEIFPYFALAWYNLGIVYKEKSLLGQMVMAFRNAAKYGSPEEEFVKEARRLVRSFEQQLEETGGPTLDDYARGEKRFGDAFEEMKNGHYEEALAGFRETLELHPNNEQSYGNMGLCYAALGQRHKALEFFDKALEIAPDYEPASINRAMVERLEEGEKLPRKGVLEIQYYKDLQEKSARAKPTSKLRKMLGA
ncbi:MAG: tetratricopeptide repeat protein [Gammaproteobacteria bacterium]|nr:tetratricopeptide repeat protein [Gammaproteobacteria bacterium]